MTDGSLFLVLTRA